MALPVREGTGHPTLSLSARRPGDRSHTSPGAARVGAGAPDPAPAAGRRAPPRRRVTCGRAGALAGGRHDRQADVRRVRPRAVDPLLRRPEVLVAGPVDVVDVLLRVAVDHGEPGALHLHHDLVTLLEAV